MKYEGFREVKCICYPNDYVTVRRKSYILNIIIINLLICLVVAAVVVAVKFFGGKAEEVLNTVADALSNGVAI